MGQQPDLIDPEQDLFSFGIDSLHLVRLLHILEHSTERQIPLKLLLTGGSLRSVAKRLFNWVMSDSAHLPAEGADGSWRIRQAEQVDVSQIEQIWLEGAQRSFRFNQQSTADELREVRSHLHRLVAHQDETFKFWVATDADSAIVAWSTIQPFHTTPWRRSRNSFGFISTYVSKTLWGQGVGGILVKHALAYARQSTDLAYVFGVQAVNNPESVRLTDYLGFLSLGTLPPSAAIPESRVIVALTKD